MVSVSERLADDAPGVIPLKTFQIHKYTLQFRDGERWVSVVQLDGNLIRELFPRALGLLESTDDVVQGCSTPEVLLLQTEFLAPLQATGCQLNATRV